MNLYGYVYNNPLAYWDKFGNDPESNISLLRDELGGDSYDTTECRRFSLFASDVLNETPIGQAKIALTGKNLQDEQVSLLEQISTAAGPVLGMCKKICGLTKATKGLGNPFKRKTSAQIDEMLKAKGFEPRGPDPLNGKGGYVNTKTGRSYHIDEANSFGEAPHVDVNRLKTYDGSLEKKKYFTGQ